MNAPHLTHTYDVKCYFSAQGQPQPISCEVPEEHHLDAFVNGVHLTQFSCTPDNLEDLVKGWLFTEGVIESTQNIESIQFNQDRKTVHVTAQVRPGFGKRDTIVYNNVKTPRLDFLTVKSGVHPADERAWLPLAFELVRIFEEGSPLHGRTFGFHSCYLSTQEGRVFRTEDIGRHNALDKAVGAALAQGCDLQKSAVMSSGRIPIDMVSKVIRSGIPALVTKAVPTSASVEIARRHGLLLVCAAHPDSVKVFSTPEE